MPASRIAFALGDLLTEVRGLMPRDAQITVDIRLNPDTYARVVDELSHHYGQQLKRVPIVRAFGGGEFVLIGGVRISTMLGSPGDG